MPKMTVDDLINFSDRQFEYQAPMKNLWQTLSENFYPERADFTITRNVGNELADGLMSSYPVIVRRDLGNAISPMLRDGDWFNISINGDPDHAGQSWLDWASKRLRRIMYERDGNFVRATREADHDYVTFGQPVMSVERNRNANGILFRTWHLRDCAWWEDETGQVCGVTRKWKPMNFQLLQYFKEGQLHRNITKDKHKNQLKEADFRHIFMPMSQYGDDSPRKYVSIWIDVANKHLVEEVPTDRKHYTVPRFQTIAGSAYAYSPAAVAGLPDARMLQAMTHTLIEAAERYARPPLIATSKVVKSSIDLGPDGITWLDQDYDERMGNALRTLNQDRGGYPIGLEMRDGIVDILASAFYINKISLPEVTREMTAYEVQERMKQYRRENLPLFAPIEAEYSGSLCEMAFDLAMDMGMLGSPYDIPESLQEQDVLFKFQSPLTESEEEKKANQFSQVSQMLAQAYELKPGVEHNLNFDEAFRDAVTGIGAPEKWLSSVEDVVSIRQNELAMQQAAMAAEQEQAA